MHNNDNGTQGDGRKMARSRKIRVILRSLGRVLRILRIAGVVATVCAFLVFVFSDNWLTRFMERSVQEELREEGLSLGAMRPTPISGFDLAESVAIEGDLHGAALAYDRRGVWIASSDGRLLHYGLEEGAVTKSLTLEELPSPRDVALSQDGRLLVADPSGIVAYVDTEGNTEVLYGRQPDDAVILTPLRVAEDGETVLILNEGQPPGIVALVDDRTIGRYGYAHVTDLVMFSGYLYVSGGHESGLPVARLSRAGADTFIPVDTTWIWALSYWDIPFVSLDVDEQGYITVVDETGHLVQLTPGARVILHAAPEIEDLGKARSVISLNDGALLVVYERGVKTYRLNEAGAMMREAVMAASSGDRTKALALWEQLTVWEPHLLSLRRWLGGAYLDLDRPREAAKHFYLASDKEGFQAAVKAEAYRVRKEHLWDVWVMIMGVTVVVWILDAVWPALPEPREEEEE